MNKQTKKIPTKPIPSTHTPPPKEKQPKVLQTLVMDLKDLQFVCPTEMEV